MTGCCKKATPLCTVADGCVVIASLAAGPAMALAVNVTGLPFNPVDVAVRVLAPAALPSVQLPTVAMPLALVVGVAPVTPPPPSAGTNVTATPATGLPN